MWNLGKKRKGSNNKGALVYGKAKSAVPREDYKPKYLILEERKRVEDALNF